MKNYLGKFIETFRSFLTPNSVVKSLGQINDELNKISSEMKMLRVDLIELKKELGSSQNKIHDLEISISERKKISLRNQDVDLLLMECIGELAKHLDSLEKSFAAMSGGKNTIVVGLKNSTALKE
ncbi:hypothetical protein GCM10007205_12940 [Oxalicibacterium flavum]|uniref:Uncharacterized protein n=1 Tax=Oxalicibacterium flavum TaxID=179467 RepID=A0A8J2XXX7_9BURK|nr:hypothetical protein [Oxalicibacterium flavum]GGC05162.1 hypothetical protein GCM10007205_12940 [Oxalicibacterium flavum]